MSVLALFAILQAASNYFIMLKRSSVVGSARLTSTRFGRVAVVCGGRSSKRNISLASGQLVFESLRRHGIEAVLIDGIPSLVDGVRAGHFSRVFNALSGWDGESGVLQGFLEACGVPCTGSKLPGCATSFDKLRSKKIWFADRIKTPAFFQPLDVSEETSLPPEFTYPLILKPIGREPNFGTLVVSSDETFRNGLSELLPFSPVIAEEYIYGEKFSITVVETQALPSIQVAVNEKLNEYSSKYKLNNHQHDNSTYNRKAEEAISQFAIKAFASLGCEHWGKVDIFRDHDGEFWAIEVNSAPDLTLLSPSMRSASALGWTYDDLVIKVLSSTLS